MILSDYVMDYDIGCATEMHRTLGNWFQKVILSEGINIETAQNGLETDIFGDLIGMKTKRIKVFLESFQS